MVAPDTIITPNYGPASYRDDIVVTCERPGSRFLVGDNEGKISVKDSLEAWVPFIKDEKGVSHVLILFDENEMEVYDENLVEAYEKAGLKVHWEPLSKPSSYSRIIAILDECYANGERITAHCTNGRGRSGRVAVGWLMHKYHLTDKEATLEVLACATAHGVSRLGSPTALNKWIAG